MPRLRSYMIGLVLASLIPLGLLAIGLIVRLDQQYRQATRENVYQTVRALSDAVEGELNDTKASLEALASSPVLDEQDLRGFHDRLVAVGETRHWTSATLIDSAGQPLVDTIAAFGAPPRPVVDRTLFDQVRRSGKPATSGDVFGPEGREAAIRVGVPVTRAGAIQYVLIAGVPPSQLRDVLTAQQLPRGWQLVVNDRNQRMVATSLDHDLFVGQPVTPTMARESARAAEGWFANIDEKGREVYSVFHRSARSGLVLVAVIPRGALDQAINHTLWTMAGGAAALLLVSLAVGLGLGRRLTTSLTTVRHAAEALGRGEAPEANRLVAIREHRAVLDALDQTAVVLRARTAEIASRVTGLTVLANLSTRLVPRGQLHGPLLDILDAGIQLTRADMGNIQLLNVTTGQLEIVVQRGFEAEFIEFFAGVADKEAACGNAMSSGQRVIVNDVTDHPIFAGTEACDVLLRAGVRAVQSTPLRNSAGDLVGMLSTHYRQPGSPDEADLHMLDMLARLAADYVERARTESEADATHALLQAADSSKDQFLALLGHELRNPLGAIANAVALLNRADSSPENRQRAREMIERQVKHVTRLVDDLLDVSRVTAGKIVLSRELLDLGKFVGNAVGAWREAGRFSRHYVSVEVASVRIEGDSARIEQILDNLIGNALKYTRDGGRIAVRVRQDQDDAIMEVADTGAGIASPLLGKVFDPYVQGDHTISRAQGGLGIGLMLVKTLVELHGGTVSVKSDGTGKGSTFTVRLPASSS